jgi:hypothetical protein
MPLLNAKGFALAVSALGSMRSLIKNSGSVLVAMPRAVEFHLLDLALISTPCVRNHVRTGSSFKTGQKGLMIDVPSVV